MNGQTKNNKALVLRLAAIVVGMFGFGFALVPLYDVFCDITGINGKTRNTAASYDFVTVDESRLVTVEFITRTNSGMPWEFEAQTKRVKVHPGEMAQVDFYVRNPSSRDIIGQAIPSVSPGTAALYLNKTECFCFNQQPLLAGQEALMPMKFYVDPQLPEDIHFFTLSYTLYDVTATSSEVAMNNK
ncbi:cytochrome c oxidase assembly protein [Aliiglaciecola sp. CAU 1673]|uniref:cytochrome c oxidase assembly protein n=1 Tax=Aliiglaciecola sp. CAU 1673 TaxID=3032595 RepID=UPI0023DB4E32|nr:cytochrome c oxidase assembly protein [Aliiglaciecola sp. CAU 1673]MDF2179257.1 cytochrome c oxidase assembly protein [Aliiglaciecola sp. CAU 1673]